MTGPKEALKRALIAGLGYDRFLVAVFHFRRLSIGLAKEHSEFYGLIPLIKPHHVVFDVGANIGYTTAVLSRAESRGVYAFEPDPDNFRCLTRTLRGCANVAPVPCGIGAADGRAELRPVVSGGVKQHALSRLQVADVPARGEVVVRSIDSFAKEIGGTVGLIKVDVEGFEVEVLRGMAATIKRDRPSLYVEVCGPKAITEYSAFAVGHGYKVYRWAWNRFAPIDTLSESGNYLFADAAVRVAS